MADPVFTLMFLGVLPVCFTGKRRSPILKEIKYKIKLLELYNYRMGFTDRVGNFREIDSIFGKSAIIINDEN